MSSLKPFVCLLCLMCLSQAFPLLEESDGIVCKAKYKISKF